MKKIKIREFPEHNYKGIYFNGKTLRLKYRANEPITDLKYPEFYDVKITNKCIGKCDFCYQNSKVDETHYHSILKKIDKFFGSMNKNQKPFQVAIGGGEPTSHPQFCNILKRFYDLGIAPNYTTNGTFIRDNKICDKIINATKKYSEAVAVSCHPHLKNDWMKAFERFHNENIKTNFHIIISDKNSVKYFKELYEKYHKKVFYFILLPYIAQGRAKSKKINYEYLFKVLHNIENEYGNIKDVAFGAHFYNQFKNNNQFGLSLYEPETMSKYLDMGDMILYPSSFDTNKPLKKIKY